jgi:DNA repair exonuclease SbcCD ATPase subunit
MYNDKYQQSRTLLFIQNKVLEVFDQIKQCWTKWEKLSSRGTTFCTELVNHHLQQRGLTDQPKDHNLTTRMLSDVHNSLQNLRDTHKDLVELNKQFKELIKILYKSYSTLTKELGVAFAERQPLFKTLPLLQIVYFAEEIEEMFAQELFLKKIVTENIRQQVDRDVLLMYTSVWLMQPYIDPKRIRFIFAAFDTETSDFISHQ